MSVTQITSEKRGTKPLCCNRCNTALPRGATFCGHCGERVNKEGDATSSPSNTTIEERYQTGDSIQHLSHENNVQTAQIVRLSHAFDTQQRRPVIIRDLDVSSFAEEERAKAIEIVQNEYDRLRKLQQPDVMSVIDLHYYEEHIYTISGWPQARKRETGKEPFPTLHDLLQSGLGLPDEETALTWAYRISKALQQLHEQNIILGSLDPHTLAMGSHDYDHLPTIMVFWLPEAIRTLLQAQGTTINVASKHFSAPEVFRDKAEVRSDIYSVGAILYLLLTGSVPAGARRKRTPRELISSINSGIAAVVMQALADRPDDRFQSAEEFADILLGLCSSTKTIRPIQHPPLPAAQETPAEQSAIDRAEEKAESTEQPEASRASEDAEAITIKVTPLQTQQARWHLAQLATEAKTGNTGNLTSLPRKPRAASRASFPPFPALKHLNFPQKNYSKRQSAQPSLKRQPHNSRRWKKRRRDTRAANRLSVISSGRPAVH